MDELYAFSALSSGLLLLRVYIVTNKRVGILLAVPITLGIEYDY